jgi:hypothetical protein
MNEIIHDSLQAMAAGGRLPQRGRGFLTCYRAFSRQVEAAMEAQSRPPPISPRCLKCGEQPKFTSSMLDTLTARTFHMFECKCGSQTWTSEKN